MKKSLAFVEARRRKILEKLALNPSCKVQELADLYAVSALTIRRDLDVLAQRGVLKRFYGGATLEQHVQQENTLQEVYKRAIAQRAAECIHEGDTLFINSSSTALQTLDYVKDKRITVITNNGKAIHRNLDPRIKLVLTGGHIQFPKEALTGEFAMQSLERVTAQKAVMGFSGVSLQGGLTTSNLDEVAINEMMLRRATEKVVVLVESRKLNYVSNFVSGNLDRVSHLITDTHADPTFVEALDKRGICVTLVQIDER
ncbi:MAG: DeoR/GlpR family DNA-binding transcription regulator [Cardiobacteriaceae bacterium]|nr:DeoR/GlpR family DNA-binding transcription regulator [Cardiobacteriaceae bacterium]